METVLQVSYGFVIWARGREAWHTRVSRCLGCMFLVIFPIVTAGAAEPQVLGLPPPLPDDVCPERQFDKWMERPTRGHSSGVLSLGHVEVEVKIHEAGQPTWCLVAGRASGRARIG